MRVELSVSKEENNLKGWEVKERKTEEILFERNPKDKQI